MSFFTKHHWSTNRIEFVVAVDEVRLLCLFMNDDLLVSFTFQRVKSSISSLWLQLGQKPRLFCLYPPTRLSLIDDKRHYNPRSKWKKEETAWSSLLVLKQIGREQDIAKDSRSKIRHKMWAIGELGREAVKTRISVQRLHGTSVGNDLMYPK
jgi:hypothetical protein